MSTDKNLTSDAEEETSEDNLEVDVEVPTDEESPAAEDEEADETEEDEFEEDEEDPKPMNVVARLYHAVSKPSYSIVTVVMAITIGMLVGMTWSIWQYMGRHILSYAQTENEPPDQKSPRTEDLPMCPDVSATGCELYPNEPACVAKANGKEIHMGTVDGCFAFRGELLDTTESNWWMERGTPFECRNVGPMGLIGLEQLQGKAFSLKPVTDMPPKIAEFYSENKGFTTRSALIAFLIMSKANGESLTDMSDEPELAALVRDMVLTSDDGLSEKERRTTAEMLGIYNAFIKLINTEIDAQRKKIAKECAGYQSDLVPIRCLAVEPPTPNPFAPNNPFAPPPAPTGTPL